MFGSIPSFQTFLAYLMWGVVVLRFVVYDFVIFNSLCLRQQSVYCFRYYRYVLLFLSYIFRDNEEMSRVILSSCLS